jgi:hypothetical protein
MSHLTTCPFCGRGEFRKEFVDLQLKGIYESSMITAEQNDQLRKLIAEARQYVSEAKKRETSVKRYARDRAFTLVTQFLKHYDLTPKGNGS